MSKIDENSDFLNSWREEQSKYAGGSEQDTTAEAIRSYIESEKRTQAESTVEQTTNTSKTELEHKLKQLTSAQEYLGQYKKQLYEKIRAIDEQLSVIEDKKLHIKSQLTGKPVEKIIWEELLKEGRI